MYRASVFVWQFQEALSTRQHISLKISTKIIFELSEWQQNHNTTTDKKNLPFFLPSWQCFAGILPLSQWLCRKSTTWFMSRRMRRHFSPLKCCSICCARARAWSSTMNHFTKSILMVNLVSVVGRFRCTSLRERNCQIVGFGSERRVLQVVA